MHVASSSEKLVPLVFDFHLVVMQGRFGGSVVTLFPGYGSGRSGTAAHDDGEVPECYQPTLPACMKLGFLIRSNC